MPLCVIPARDYRAILELDDPRPAGADTQHATGAGRAHDLRRHGLARGGHGVGGAATPLPEVAVLAEANPARD